MTWKDKYGEPLENFVARQKKAKKDKVKEKAKGLQSMLTEYFHLTKKNIKKEKDAAAVQTLQNVFENKQYDYDKMSVPSDDDIKIIAEVPPQEVSAWLMHDTSKTKSATRSWTSSISSTTTPVMQKEPVPVRSKQNDDKSDGLVYDGSQVVAVKETQEFDVKPEPFVKKEDDSSMEQPSQPAEDKPTEWESFLMKQLELLSKGFNEMKEIVNRHTTLPAKMNVVSKIKWKLQAGHPTVKSGKKEAKKKKGSTDMKSKTATKIIKTSEEDEDKSDGNSKLTSTSEVSTAQNDISYNPLNQPIPEEDKN